MNVLEAARYALEETRLHGSVLILKASGIAEPDFLAAEPGGMRTALRVDGKKLDGVIVGGYYFPDGVRLAFRPDARQDAPVDGAPVEKAAPRRTVHAIVGNTWYSIDLPAPASAPNPESDFDQALFHALHG